MTTIINGKEIFYTIVGISYKCLPLGSSRYELRITDKCIWNLIHLFEGRMFFHLKEQRYTTSSQHMATSAEHHVSFESEYSEWNSCLVILAFNLILLRSRNQRSEWCSSEISFNAMTGKHGCRALTSNHRIRIRI